MPVSDYLRPQPDYHCGIPPFIRQRLAQFTPDTDRIEIQRAEEMYGRVCDFIEKALKGNVPVEHEQKAADIAACLIFDAAFIHDALCRAGHPVGAFPYDIYADKIAPQAKPDETGEEEESDAGSDG